MSVHDTWRGFPSSPTEDGSTTVNVAVRLALLEDASRRAEAASTAAATALASLAHEVAEMRGGRRWTNALLTLLIAAAGAVAAVLQLRGGR